MAGQKMGIISNPTPLTPSFPRKRESIRFGNGKAAIGRGALDSRFRGNDGMGKNDDVEEDV